VLLYDVALRIDVDDNYESTLLANWGYDTTSLMNILMSIIRGPEHPDKRMYRWIGTKDAGYDHHEAHDNGFTCYDRAVILGVRGT
jgi:hypothetical protein